MSQPPTITVPYTAEPRPADSVAETPLLADPRLDELDRLAHLLDARWRIPGVGWRVGLDGVVGLIPGIGDAAGGLVSAYIILQAHRMGVPKHKLLRMAGNVGLDTLVGSVPILGSIFDIAFKANLRNIRLVRRHIERESERDGRNAR